MVLQHISYYRNLNEIKNNMFKNKEKLTLLEEVNHQSKLINSLNSDIKDLNQDLIDLYDNIDNLIDENNKLSHQNEILERDIVEYTTHIGNYANEITSLRQELNQAKDLSSILDKVLYNQPQLYSRTGIISTLCDNGSGYILELSDDIPQYVEDIFDQEKKVIKQESNLGIQIDKEGNVTTGRTKLPCDKYRNYKLKQL